MNNYLANNYYDSKSGLWLDFSKMNFPSDFVDSNAQKIEQAFKAMKELENGAISNPSEKRMVGHYWLRNADIAPVEQKEDITKTLAEISDFTKKVHEGQILSSVGKKFTHAVVIGIGGSNLGPVLVSSALSDENDKMKILFIDNTDPQGMEAVFKKIAPVLEQTMIIVISKSGGTIETRNGMVEMRAFYDKNNVDFFKNTVCITQIGSKLYQYGEGNWLSVFPMWDWVGGRTSLLSAVGILPLSLQGLDVKSLLDGAKYCDTLTRVDNAKSNPSMLLSLLWYAQSGGKGGTAMVVLPYKDKLELLANYLQQLIMESLGKQYDLDGKEVRQGLGVFGNKGTTFQHSYGQQLVAGSDPYFVNFISILKDRDGEDLIVGEDSTSGDYLQAFMLGTEYALTANNRPNMTLTLPTVNAYYVGMLIALFERAVGFYATLININAYDQPAVEYGKKAASAIIDLKNSIIAHLNANKGTAYTAETLAQALSYDIPQNVLKVALHLAENGKIQKADSDNLLDIQFCVK